VKQYINYVTDIYKKQNYLSKLISSFTSPSLPFSLFDYECCWDGNSNRKWKEGNVKFNFPKSKKSSNYRLLFQQFFNKYRIYIIIIVLLFTSLLGSYISNLFYSKWRSQQLTNKKFKMNNARELHILKKGK